MATLESKQSERIPKDKIASALEGMRSLKRKETDDVSAKAAVKQMRRQIERLLKLEYSAEEISALLEQYEIFISPERLKYFLSEVKKETRKKGQSAAGKKTAVATPPKENGSAASGDTQDGQHQESATSTQNESGSPKTQALNKKGTRPASEVKSNPQPVSHSFEPVLIDNNDL